ncbi:MAG: UDP-2,3-diacylglucosamine diphosphatase LpxI [Candidatus Omnitrophica bacterium]|nr:UDP-2,3-diacylglucosamine diphosphatase LpxI [Candidatus Omnitrophota bacterium]
MLKNQSGALRALAVKQIKIMEKIGLIAGNRKFPLLFAKEAKKKNYSIVAVAIKGDTSGKLKKLVDKIYWLGLSEYSRLFKIFKDEGITKVVMAGQISPRRLFSKEINKDPELRDLLSSIKDKRADTIFGKIAEKLKEHGLELLDSTIFITDYLPKKGVLTKKKPDELLSEDIDFGLHLAKAVGELDIGQTVAVKSKAIIAVEALEGTDNLIKRSGKISRGGITIVKVSKPKQDMRFDVPVVGLNTIKNLIRIGAQCLAIEADKTLFIDKKESLALADKKGLIIVAV